MSLDSIEVSRSKTLSHESTNKMKTTADRQGQHETGSRGQKTQRTQLNVETNSTGRAAAMKQQHLQQRPSSQMSLAHSPQHAKNNARGNV